MRQGHDNVHSMVCNNRSRSQNLNATDRQTDTQGHTSNMAMLKFCIVYAFHSRKPVIMLLMLPYCVCVWVRSLHLLNQLSRYMMSYIWRPPKHHRFNFPTINNNNMADKRICEAVATQPRTMFRNLAIIQDFKVCKIHDGRKLAVFLSVGGFGLEWKSQWMNA